MSEHDEPWSLLMVKDHALDDLLGVSTYSPEAARDDDRPWRKISTSPEISPAERSEKSAASLKAGSYAKAAQLKLVNHRHHEKSWEPNCSDRRRLGGEKSPPKPPFAESPVSTSDSQAPKPAGPG